MNNINIGICIKLSKVGASDFVLPFVKNNKINKILLFRNERILDLPKIENISIEKIKSSFLKEIAKFILMIFKINSRVKLLIGFYEIPHGLYAVIVGKLKKIPTVVCFLSNIDYKIIRKGFRLWLTLWILKNADYVTVTGSVSKDKLIAKGINRGRISILPNPVNKDIFKPFLIDKKFDLITLSNLFVEKRVDLFIKLVAELYKLHPTLKVGIAGKGPEFNNLKLLTNSLGLDNVISFLGYVDNPALFYNSGKIFVLTSETEGLPRTILESMSCGIPCISVKVGDIEDVIKNNINGYLLSENNLIDDFLKYVSFLLENNITYNEFSKNSMEFVNTNYSIETGTKFWNDFIIKNNINQCKQ